MVLKVSLLLLPAAAAALRLLRLRRLLLRLR